MWRYEKAKVDLRHVLYDYGEGLVGPSTSYLQQRHHVTIYILLVDRIRSCKSMQGVNTTKPEL